MVTLELSNLSRSHEATSGAVTLGTPPPPAFRPDRFPCTGILEPIVIDIVQKVSPTLGCLRRRFLRVTSGRTHILVPNDGCMVLLPSARLR